MKFYTGVGSRKTPDDILQVMREAAQYLGGLGYCLRSGGAKGSDSAFEEGCGSYPKQIYYADDCTEASMKIAAQFHPVWSKLSEYAKKLHGRNSFQVLGYDLNLPSQFLICWTPDGCISHAERTIETGGTGTAISIAEHYGVKIYNLKRSDHLERILAKVRKKNIKVRNR